MLPVSSSPSEEPVFPESVPVTVAVAAFEATIGHTHEELRPSIADNVHFLNHLLEEAGVIPRNPTSDG